MEVKQQCEICKSELCVSNCYKCYNKKCTICFKVLCHRCLGKFCNPHSDPTYSPLPYCKKHNPLCVGCDEVLCGYCRMGDPWCGCEKCGSGPYCYIECKDDHDCEKQLRINNATKASLCLIWMRKNFKEEIGLFGMIPKEILLIIAKYNYIFAHEND